MKKLIALLLLAAFVSVGAIGCGGDTKTGGTTKSTASSPATPPK